MKRSIGIAGAGFAGAVLARELAESGLFQIDIFDERNHIAGNCYTNRDEETGIMIHQYGPHIFNTDRKEVWDYIQRWGEMIPFINRVKAITEKGIFSLPINLLTINQFFHKHFSPIEAQKFISKIGEKSISEPKNFEEQARKFLGDEIYKNFFYGYTKKQWGVEPRELPSSILKRLPIRFNYDDNYYNQTYQGIPREGYTAIIEKILNHPNISVHLGEKMQPSYKNYFAHLFWSGAMDGYFNNVYGRLGYRTLKFNRLVSKGDFQGNAVINYCQESVPYTRISEHKHFSPWENHEKTVCFQEYSLLCKEDETPYYPLRLVDDKTLLEKYIALSEKEKKVTFIGRLGTYRYLDMHVVIAESLDLAKTCLMTDINTWPSFSHHPLK